jgi:ABC-type Fe3+ transport system permease subunit
MIAENMVRNAVAVGAVFPGNFFQCLFIARKEQFNNLSVLHIPFPLSPIMTLFLHPSYRKNTKDINLLRPYLTNLTEHTYIPIGRLMELKEQILSSAVTVGASGALFGILLAFAMIFPQARMMLLFIPYPIRAPYFVAIYAVIELFCGVAQTADGVAHFAHLGGMLFGLILILFWKKSGKFYN